MCGIAGFFNASVDDAVIREGLSRLTHRGPDANGYYKAGSNGLLHTRLSIIDLSARGAQPYYFADLVLVFNGELYNYKEVRELLIKNGYSFESNSDTEVLIKAFHCWREKCVEHFIGMFAFAIYDTTQDALWLFRDRLGVKPLYYFILGNELYFASELKALEVFSIPKKIDPEAVTEYFRFGFIGGDRSIFQDVRKLKPGHFLVMRRNGSHVTRYWHSQNGSGEDGTRTESDWTDELEGLLESAFQYRMVSDVPVGVFLSGGIDSSLLTAVLQKKHGNIHTFTIGFEENEFDETPFAVAVANALETNHTSKTLRLEEARNLLFGFYDIYDEPFADTSGIPTACVTGIAKEAGMKVVLSADGGDELFGGYTHYQEALSFYRKVTSLPGSVRRGIRNTIRTVFPAGVRSRFVNYNLEHKAYAVEELLSAENPTDFFEAFVANQAGDEIARMTKKISGLAQPLPHQSHPLQQMMDWDLHHFLPDDLLVKVDRATMFHSLECREPFLDHRLVEYSARLPLSLKIRNGKGKYILRQLLKRYLPESLFERPKRGFSIPVFSWFRRELDDLFEKYLTPEEITRTGVLDAGEIAKEYAKYRVYKKQNKPYNIEKMWRILSFMMWWEKYGK